MSDEPFRIFVGWSKNESFTVAKILSEWIKGFFKFGIVDVFFSEESIGPGESSVEIIESYLRIANAGIFCITKENLHESTGWIASEAGAIIGNSNNTPKSKNLIIPFLCGLKSNDALLNGESFRSLMKGKQQAECDNKDEVFIMMSRINSRVMDKTSVGYPEDKFKEKFEEKYSLLESKLVKIGMGNVDHTNTKKPLINIEVTEWEDQVLWLIFKSGNPANEYCTVLSKIYALFESGQYCYGEIFQALILLEVRELISKQLHGVPSIKLTDTGIKRMQGLAKYAFEQGYFSNNCS